MQNIELTEQEQVLLRELLTRQQATSETAKPYNRTWLKHPDKFVVSFDGRKLHKLRKASSEPQWVQLLSDGWTPASEADIKPFEQLKQIPAAVKLAKLAEHRKINAEKIIADYYGTQLPSDEDEKTVEQDKPAGNRRPRTKAVD